MKDEGNGVQTVFENGDFTVDYQAGSVFVGKEEVHLTPIEYKLLILLAKNVGKVLTHNYIFYMKSGVFILIMSQLYGYLWQR